ncbi:MAG TPA: hypothetical protein VFB12_07880 [Ktedonobacteraceae bacterium]|nr:hypothetical protein [Ktedonobacteraceae bacterium]
MPALDQSIFRERALEKYMRRKEQQTILRLVSPQMFMFLWALLFLAVCAGVLVGSIQNPVLVQGKGVVVQQKAANGTTQGIVVLLLLPPDQQANLKVGQPVTISITSANITFKTTLQTVESGVMSPTEITGQIVNNPQLSLAQTVSGPAVVALAPVEPMSFAKTYLGSQCQAQVQIGSQSALSLVPGFNNLPNPGDIPTFFANLYQGINRMFNNLFKNF